MSLFFVSFAALAAPEPSTGVNSSIDQVVASSNMERDRNRSNATRSKEEISIVFDKNKSVIFRTFKRALRKDPTLEGKIVFELVISPTGQVSSVKILSSEVNSPEFEDTLAEKIKLFMFESKKVDEMIVRYPIDLLPS